MKVGVGDTVTSAQGDIPVGAHPMPIGVQDHLADATPPPGSAGQGEETDAFQVKHLIPHSVAGKVRPSAQGLLEVRDGGSSETREGPFHGPEAGSCVS